MTTVTTSTRRRGLSATLGDVYHERTNFNFIGRSKIWLTFSSLMVAVSIGALLLIGINLGIDFEGGTQWEFSVASDNTSSTQVREALEDTPARDSRVLTLSNGGVRVQSSELKTADRELVTQALSGYFKVDASAISIVSVGPTWGEQVSQKALIALLFFFILISVYLTFRFEWKMALASIIAVVHDILITIGVYAITGFEVAPATVVAILTILGFSLYDTVVVFDKIKENQPTLGREKGDSYSSMVNRSMNQVLMRSLNTSFIALLPVISLLVVGNGILGAVTLRDFSLALFVGLLVGAYSSIFVATPILVILKEREPRFKALRDRSGSVESAVAVEPVALADEVVTPGATPKPNNQSVVPRARQYRRGKRR